MDQGAYLDSLRLVCALAGCAVRQQAPDPSMLECVDSQQLIDAAKSHTLAAITAMALQSAGVNTSQVSQEAARGLWKETQLEEDWVLVREALENAGIWYCPLKGAVLKDEYPQTGMRQMADYDVLFDAERTDDVRSIMEALGFRCEIFGATHHDVYHKLPVSNFEMHRSLFSVSSAPEMVEHFQNVKDHLTKDPDNEFGWHMDVTECYVYLMAHAHKHFALGGTGLRTPLDVYVYLRNHEDELNWERIREGTHELGIDDFEERMRTFAQRVFALEKPLALQADDEELFRYLATSGTYGTTVHQVQNKLAKKGRGVPRKLAYLVERVFPSREIFREVYPFYSGSRLLYPAMVVFRLGRALTVSRKRVLTELAVILHRNNKVES